MNDTSSDKVRNLESRVTEAGEAVGERVRSATAVAAAATGQVQKKFRMQPRLPQRQADRQRKCWAMRTRQHSKLGRKQAEWRRTPSMRVVARPDRFRGRSTKTRCSRFWSAT
jgi:hypothetical protein